MDERNSFSIGFLAKDSRCDKRGETSIVMSISINKQRVTVALPMKVKPEVFRHKMQSIRMNDVREFCNIYYQRVNQSVLELLRNGDDITPKKIKAIVFNEKKNELLLQDAWNNYLRHLSKKVDVSMDLSTWQKYQRVMRQTIAVFGKDCNVLEWNINTITDFYYDMVKKVSLNYAYKIVSKIKGMMKYNNLDISFFSELEMKREKKDVQYLVPDEVERILSKDFGIERINAVRDLFIFQCYTGLAFTDMMNLTKSDILQSPQGYYLHKERQKTKVAYTILLLPKAMAILEKYDYALPRISNQKCNAYLKEIADICGIHKPLHTHIARHTFATMMLNSGISLDEVAKMLGHSSTNQTRQYAKMRDVTVLNAMSKLL